MGFFHRSSFYKSRGTLVVPGLLVVVGCILILAACLPGSNPPPEPTATPGPKVDPGNINISVVDQNESPMMRGVVVRVANTNQVDGDDHDMLRLTSCNDDQYITAWAVGFYISTVKCHAGTTEYTLKLFPINVSNNTTLSWIPAGQIGNTFPNCSACHANPEGMNEFFEWQKDGHSGVFRDQYFWTMYLGTDIYGNRSENTRWILDASGNQTRLVPDPSKAYYGPGFKLDFPSENGNCAYCHAPVSAVGSQLRLDLTQTINETRRGQVSAYTEGVTCDICHKVVNVKLDSDDKPYPDKPGVLSYEFIHEDRLLFMGPLAGVLDVDAPDLNFSCAPVFSESRFCAPCHTAKFYGTQIYDSYGEWLTSPYSDKGGEKYKTCQSCHMLPTGVDKLADAPRTRARQACSQNNDSFSDFNHNMMLRGDDNISSLIKQAATLKLGAEVKGGKINLSVTVTNENAGHKFPTDSPLRHLILVIEATASNGTRVPLIDGDVIPPWGGIGNGTLDYAGRPGTIYANILTDVDTFVSPTLAYWNPIQPTWESSDTRIPAGEAVESKYVFALPPDKQAKFTVRLIYRYAFIDLVRLKGWPVNDIVAVEAEAKIP